MVMVCSACDVDLCELCGHDCECAHPHPHAHPASSQSAPLAA